MIVHNKKILASILFVLISFICTAAQDPPVPDGRGGGGPPPPPGAPIDEGLMILFVVALIYGIYRALKFSKKPTQV